MNDKPIFIFINNISIIRKHIRRYANKQQQPANTASILFLLCLNIGSKLAANARENKSLSIFIFNKILFYFQFFQGNRREAHPKQTISEQLVLRDGEMGQKGFTDHLAGYFFLPIFSLAKIQIIADAAAGKIQNNSLFPSDTIIPITVKHSSTAAATYTFFHLSIISILLSRSAVLLIYSFISALAGLPVEINFHNLSFAV